RDKANTDFICQDKVTRTDRHATNGHWSINRDGLDAPLSGDWAHAARPDRITDLAGVIDVAHRAIDNGAELALSPSNARRDAAHIGNLVNALQDEHISQFRKIVCLDLTKQGLAIHYRVTHRYFCTDVVHSQCAADDARLGISRMKHCGWHGAGNSQFVHRVRRHSGEVRKGTKTVKDFCWYRRQLDHSERAGPKLAQRLFCHCCFTDLIGLTGLSTGQSVSFSGITCAVHFARMPLLTLAPV